MGRPKIYETSEELARDIKHYFDTITKTKLVTESVFDGLDEEGKELYKQVPMINNAGEQVTRVHYLEHPTILGMCRFLGIHRETLLNYEKENKDFFDTIKGAKGRIEEYLENGLYRKDQVTGIIFNLKNNFGWKDKQDIEHSGDMGVRIIDDIKD